MRVATAADFSRDVLVTVPGTELQVRCRRPNLLNQIAAGALPQPLVQAAMAVIQEGAFDMVHAPAETVTTYAEFLDRWTCLAVVEPRVVMTQDEAVTGAVWVDDLEVNLKTAILAATIGPGKMPGTPVDPAVAEFRDGQSDGAAPGSDGAAVRDAAIDAAAHP